MDKRLIVELLPGPAFLLGNALGGIFVGAGFGVAATIAAILLRWRWDRRLPLLALSIFGLTIVLLGLGLVMDDTTYVKISNTAGSLAFAAIIAAGAWLQPSLLRRTLGYSIHVSDAGWRMLHIGWITLSLARAALNEAIWRSTSDGAWALYNGISDIVWIGLFFAVTFAVAHLYWDEPDPENPAPPPPLPD